MTQLQELMLAYFLPVGKFVSTVDVDYPDTEYFCWHIGFLVYGSCMPLTGKYLGSA